MSTSTDPYVHHVYVTEVDGFFIRLPVKRLTRSMLLDRVEQLRSVGRYHAAEAAYELAMLY